MTNQPFSDIATIELDNVTGGAGVKASWDSIKQQASGYCPNTVEKYAHLDPSMINRSKAQKMGNECVSEMGPFMGGLARGKINNAIDQAFPTK